MEAPTLATTPAAGVVPDAVRLLGIVEAERAREEAAAAATMRAVAEFTDLHRVSSHLDAAIDPETREFLLDEDGRGTETQLRLAGEGTFMVAEFAVTELAATLGMSEPAARGYVGQCIELRDRLPRLWGQVMAGRLPAWKGRLVAKDTIPLNPEAAAYVDAQLAPFAHQISPWRILRAVEAAVLRHDPDLAETRARAAAERRGVWLEDHLDGVTELHAVADTPDAHALDAALEAVATDLGELGDTRPRQARRAAALGILADPQYALDLHAATQPPASDGVAATPQPKRAPLLHVHLHTDAVGGNTGDAGGVGRVDGLGARCQEALRRWLGEATPGTPIQLTPVVDLTTHITVDAYEAPDKLRTQIEHRDQRCQFPWCGRIGTFDLDHIEEYVPLEEGGPPGQTNTLNLARLCRYHHRVKTHPGQHGTWDYARQPDGSLRWSSPLGRHYLVDHTGTSPAA